MLNDDFRDVPRKDSEVRALATQLRAHFGIADAERIDVLRCAEHKSIWTIKGVVPLRFEVVADAQMTSNDGLTSYDGRSIVIQIPRRIRHKAFFGEGYARNTIAHEFGHAVMHFEKLTRGAVLARRAVGNLTPKWIAPYESAEHHAKVFAPSFLINEGAANSLSLIDEISARFGVSRVSAEIYFEQLQAERDRPASKERVRRMADELLSSASRKPAGLRYLSDCCVVCHQQTVVAVGHKYLCHTCDTLYDRFQDGDSAQ